MRRLWRQLGIIWIMSVFWFQRFKFQRFEFFGQLVINFIDVGLVGFIWYLVARHSELPLSPQYILSYYLLISVTISLLFNQLGVGNILLKEIKDGTFNRYLLQPIHPIVASYATMMGRTLLSRLVHIILYSLAAVFIFTLEIRNIPVLLMVLVIGFAINLGFNVLVATMGFYITDAQGFKNTILHSFRFLQGALVPLILLPEGLQRVLAYTPFPASLYWPVVALRGDAVPIASIAYGAAWAVVIPVSALYFFRYSLRKYEGVGI